MRAHSRLAFVAAALLALICTVSNAAHAQTSVDETVRKLKPSRGISVEPANPKVEELQKQQEQGRPLSEVDRKEIAKVAEKTDAKVDMPIFFGYNSDQILAVSVPELTKLGEALARDDLKGQKFLINGHTDARRSDQYNLDLSQRRAAAILKFLVEIGKIDAKRLVAVGFGRQQLKNKQDPFAAENRRVEIVTAAQ